MMRRIKKISLESKIILIIAGIILLSTWIYISFIKPHVYKKIDISYTGIKYQSDNANSEEYINIEIQGEYTTGLLGAHDQFSGKVIIGDRILKYSNPPIKFNLNNMAVLPIYKGIIYLNKNFDKIAIQIGELEKNGNISYGYKNGWFISAPSENREEAVDISNDLIQRMDNDFIIN